MKYIWEEEDIRQGRRAQVVETSNTILIVLLESPVVHRRFAMVYEDTSVVSVPYTQQEIAHILTENKCIPF